MGVIYIWVGFWLLAHFTRDLSQAEKKITVVTSWANAQNDNYFIQNGRSCHFVSCSACNNKYSFLSLRQVTCFMGQEPKTNTDVEDLRRLTYNSSGLSSKFAILRFSAREIFSIMYLDSSLLFCMSRLDTPELKSSWDTILVCNDCWFWFPIW